MKRVIVIGCPGAGKSTFARKLRDKTGLPLFYLDRIWHLPDRTTVSREEFDAKLAEIIATDEWIIDGNYSRTLETRLKACDTVFLLDYPLDVCLEGAESGLDRNTKKSRGLRKSWMKNFGSGSWNFRIHSFPASISCWSIIMTGDRFMFCVPERKLMSS